MTKIRTKIIIIIALSTLLYAKGYTQDNPYDNMTSPSPTVAELGKYGSWPVDYYHGLPSIDILLYEVKVGQISLPISLSYHASGIKVDQEASWVGLGWSLNAGGVITRQIKGESDFRSNNYTSKTFEQIDNGDYPTFQEVEHLTNDYHSLDGEPDIFNYNFAGYSGQFIIDKKKNNKIICLGNNDGLKFGNITFQDDANPLSSQFEILDKNGVKYVFRELEISEPYTHIYNYFENIKTFQYYNHATNLQEISSWYLTEIIAPNNTGNIALHYSEDKTVRVGNPSGSKFYFQRLNQWVYNPEIAYDCVESGPLVNEGLFNISCSTSKGKKLDYISTSNGITINFNDDFIREDLFLYPDFSVNDRLTPRTALSSISIDYNGERIKSYHFEYEYFESSITTADVKAVNTYNHFIKAYGIDNLDVTPFNLRLKLKQLVTYDETDTESLKPYVFNYFGEEIGEPQMPFKKAFGGKDCHGYYRSTITAEEASNFENMFPNIGAAIPSIHDGVSLYGHNTDCPVWLDGIIMDYEGYRFNYPLGGGSKLYNLGSNIEPDIAYCRTYSLKEIEYPTGGKTIFDYELNGAVTCTNSLLGHPYLSVNYGGGLRIKSITDNSNSTNISKEYVYSTPLTNKLQQWMTLSPLSSQTNEFKYEIHSQPLVESNPVCYSKVIESGLPGTIEYNYYNPQDNQTNYESRYFGLSIAGGDCAVTFTAYTFDKPFYPYWEDISGNDFFWGKLKSKIIFDVSNDTIQKELMEYDFIEGDPIFATKVSKATTYNGCNAINNQNINFTNTSSGNLRVNVYKIQTGEGFLNKNTVTSYYPLGAKITTSTNYMYDHDYDLLKEKTTSASDGSLVKTTYLYPTDFDVIPTAAPLNTMRTKNMLNYVIEKQTWKDDGIISSVFNKYEDEVTPRIGKVYSLESDIPLIVSDFYGLDNWGNLKSPTHYVLESTVNGYDTCGNPLELLSKNGINTSYLWDATKTYIMAKVEGATYSQVSSQNGKASNYNSKSLWTSLNGLAPNALITTYSYQPLIGITEMTDPSGLTINYTYDQFGRLELIKDNNGNLVQKYEYNYKD
ncbi:MAG: hypothetical protein ACERKD_17150 [Prolixibacteraceae bacterium]